MDARTSSVARRWRLRHAALACAAVFAAGCVAGREGLIFPEAAPPDAGRAGASAEALWDGEDEVSLDEDDEDWADEEASGFWHGAWDEEEPEPEQADAAEGDVGAAAAGIALRRGRAVVPRYGVVVNFSAWDPDSMVSDFARLRAAGVRYARIMFFSYDDDALIASGGSIERVFENERPRFDAVMDAAAQAGVSILPVLARAGTQADGSHDILGISGGGDGLDRVHWEQFVHLVAARYGLVAAPQPSDCPGREQYGSFWRERARCAVAPVPIRVWEIWNEPSSAHMWAGTCASCPAPSGGDYAQLLRVSRHALRVVHPQNRVLLGGLAPQRGGYTPAQFVRDVAEAEGGLRLFDAVALHPYSNTVPEAVDQVRELAGELERLRLIRGEPDDVRIWITEIGWSVPNGIECEADRDGTCATRRITVKNRGWQQRRMSAFARAMRGHERDWRVGSVFWFAFRDIPNPDGRWDHDCGLLRLDGTDRSLRRYGRIAARYRWTRPPRRRL